MSNLNEDKIIEDIRSNFKKNDSSATAGYVYESASDVSEFVSTGSKVLDLVLANKFDGGVPVGRFTEICGDEGAGKTLLASYIMANTQKKGGIAIFIDSERAASREVLAAIGVDLKKLIHVQADSIEDVFRAMESIIRSIRETKVTDKLITIVWDSVAATSTLAEIESNFGDHTIGLKARLIGQALRKMTPIVSDCRVCVVFINQLRTKIGITFGDSDTTPGGKAIPFHASIRLKLSNYQQIKDGDRKIVVGKVIKCKVLKNKVGPSTGREILYTIRWGDKPGAYLDESATIFDALELSGDIKKITAQKFALMLPSGQIEFKRTNWANLLQSDPAVFAEVKKLLEKNLIITADNITDNFVKELDENSE
jgi:recombination protein RecA